MPGYARRRVIDLSGNGRADDLDHGLTRYFYRHLVASSGAFVVTVDAFEDFHTAMQIKLLREISGPSFSGGPVRQEILRLARD